jgi:ATPase family AAA domain-containing protein 2
VGGGYVGTGKTLVARALANACTADGQRVAFFMRKVGESRFPITPSLFVCLSCWTHWRRVPTACRSGWLLFDQAKAMQPAIIFFDEIDGLAPVRSMKVDQVHSSIVSTLLALMDGLDNRGQVVVIGATNRLDAIDPALRRPGRFDRELGFQLPNKDARRAILDIHSRHWSPPLTPSFKDAISAATAGYCGADLKALCTEATLNAVRRRYPQIYASTKKLLVDPAKIKISLSDFVEAFNRLVPSSHRSAGICGCVLANR